VVLFEIDVPGLPGVDAVAQLNLLAPASRVLILTTAGPNHVVEAIVAGASGYILKTAATENIIAAIRATAGGESVISSQIAGKLLDRIRDRDISSTVNHDFADAIRAALTMRELEIFTKLASGKSNEAIGNELALSTSTVCNHVVSILSKLQLENRVQAAVQAVRSGIA
jgi:DNA-binding NarL/FixJ family response regulator